MNAKRKTAVNGSKTIRGRDDKQLPSLSVGQIKTYTSGWQQELLDELE